MLALLQKLTPRLFHKHEIVAAELDEAAEFYFVMSGKWEVGYEINKVRRYRMQFGPRTVVGAFASMFQRRHNWNYRAATDLDVLSMQRKSFTSLDANFPYFTD